ncbi:hypothetical protein N431DRAFT_485080 [Stipitochalara longipes BDJ]|nr:hypothetical protein N431DRAFT_485080 [Stipitochalara longipes BDJ]
MSNCEDASESSLDLPPSIPRNSSITDFSKVFSRRSHASRKSQSRYSQSIDTSEAYGSENSQVLYMAPKQKQKSRARDRSLSCISNGSNRRMDGSSDAKDLGEEDLDQRAALNIIDREIFEWQYVCQTGRPYWWSPEAKYQRSRKAPPRSTTDTGPRIWYREIDERPKAAYEVQRRAVSDSFLSDPSTVDEMAHLVAIQLLSACFTLPPDSIIRMPTPNYTSLDKHGSTRFPDPRMISSLRMHANFRYSPSFGHQPRNSSPVQTWTGTYDGPFRISTSPAEQTGTTTPDIGTSGSPSKRTRIHRALYPTEGSDPGDREGGEFVSCCSKGEIEPTASKKLLYRRRGTHDADCKQSKFPPPPRRSQEYGEEDHPTTAYPVSKPSQQPPKMTYRLQPMIRSEPHHVFVQPVRELVVKRWRSFTRRFGGSLHSALPGSRSEYPTSGSESGASEASSPALSTDARKRRLRAQERGDIHSSSIESTPHFNSPASEAYLPDPSGRISPYQIDSPDAARSPLADTLRETTSLVTAETPSAGRGKKPWLGHASPSDAWILSRSQPSGKASGGSISSKLDSPLSFPSKSTSPTSTHLYSSRKTANRNRRRSMLSEAHTPEDFQPASRTSEVVERSILSAVGSALASPKEEAPQSLSTRVRRQEHEDATAGSTFGAFNSTTDMRVRHRERPGFSRTSTSGTQIFTPESDGVELDGLPVGPDRSRWARKGGRRERTYL